MKRIIDLNQDRRNLLFETTAREMKVSRTVIEKDFWVCFVLNYLLNESNYKDCFISKKMRASNIFFSRVLFRRDRKRTEPIKVEKIFFKKLFSIFILENP